MTAPFYPRNEAPMFLCVTLLIIAFVTCNDTRPRADDYAGMPTFSIPFMEFDSLLSCSEAAQDSSARAFDSAVLEAIERKKIRGYATTKPKPVDTLKITRINPHYGEGYRK
jgi:hypothetical protein